MMFRTSLAHAIHQIESPDALGEVLRSLTFPGPGFGCYQTFEVRPEASEWRRPHRERFWAGLDYDDPADLATLGEGYYWKLDGLAVEVCWFWDGDGTLAFAATVDRRRRIVVNTDCKKDYNWREVAA